MATVQIKHVPDDVHQILRRRAAAKGQSLQEYMLAQLTEQARQPTVEELFAKIGRDSGGRIGRQFAVDAIRADRDSR